ncbi:DUF2231 domain-containing protein [Bradyrhizobium sp.]|jgi:uncharacterized membrane protein|uniref:DUF2231 domain-containing protein n=1 Tax=Bradyrhizobium sp. TaxID=376 RepID=UPI003C488E54
MRFLGHPIHPMLVHFPIALWTVAAGAYVASAAGVNEPVAMIAKLANIGGLIMAMVAMFAGMLELRSIDSKSEAMRIATWHMMIMATVWLCFLAALMLSILSGIDHSRAQVAAAACAVAGFLLMGVGGWYGGRLVYEFGVAVKDRT